jgi:hypothetical protein
LEKAQRGDPVIEMERQILGALCRVEHGEPLRQLARELRFYCWREPAHEAIFEVLMALPAASPEIIREQLPARITRRGFPDVSWEQLFQYPAIPMSEAEELMRRLLQSQSS